MPDMIEGKHGFHLDCEKRQLSDSGLWFEPFEMRLKEHRNWESNKCGSRN
jgi:hypothetical protein